MMAKIDIPAYRQSITERLDAESATAAELRREVEETGSKKKANRLKVVQDLVDSYERSLKDIERFPDSVGVATVAAIHFVCYGDEVVCVIGGTVQDYIYFNGATSLYWGMMLHALEEGLPAVQLLRHLRHLRAGPRRPRRVRIQEGLRRRSGPAGGRLCRCRSVPPSSTPTGWPGSRGSGPHPARQAADKRA